VLCHRPGQLAFRIDTWTIGPSSSITPPLPSQSYAGEVNGDLLVGNLGLGTTAPLELSKGVTCVRVQLSKPTSLQVFIEKREDAGPCVVGAGLVVGESDNA
jgi:hypothetical protein